jgi:predicted RNase H-like HicB family nuclease
VLIVRRSVRCLASLSAGGYVQAMRGEFTAVIEVAEEGGYWATCPEVPGANGQGETVVEAKQSLANAIRLILEDRLEDALRGLPQEAIRDVVTVP